MKRLIVVGLALLLAGCVTAGDPPQGDAPNGGSAEPVHDEAYLGYARRVGKTYWLQKYITLNVCPVATHVTYCETAVKIDIDSGPIKFERLDGAKYRYAYYVSWSGGAGWVDAGLVYDFQLLDKPRIEKRVGGPVKIGMTRQQVVDSSLGLPDSTKSWTGKDHVTEHWFYGGKDKQVIFFEDGIVTVIKRN